jgi:hypothetical protein
MTFDISTSDMMLQMIPNVTNKYDTGIILYNNTKIIIRIAVHNLYMDK